jgi:GNAT superfamily N-acetyltransferase
MHGIDTASKETQSVIIRRLRPSDLERVIAIDARASGRRRVEYFKLKLEMAINETGIEVSLAAEIDEMFVGFLIARVYLGDFGIAEPSAALEAMGVHTDFRGHGVGHALLRQLTTNLLGLGVGMVATEVKWDEPSMLAFLHGEGFKLAPRLCLDLECESFRRREDTQT